MVVALAEVPPEITPAPREPRSRAREMRERLLEFHPLTMVWHVGSDPDAPEISFERVKTEALRSGFVSWRQGRGPLEDMVRQPFHHPEIGVAYGEDGRLAVDEEKFGSEKVERLLTDGVDFHPDAAAGYHYLLGHIQELDRVRVVKTHIVAPNVARFNQRDDQIALQELIYPPLIRGHQDAIGQFFLLAPVKIMSVDAPGLGSAEELRRDFSLLFGDKFDSEGVLVETKTDRSLRAIHSCSGGPMLDVMKTGAVDIIHWDTRKLGVSPILGDPTTLRGYLDHGGMIGLGGTPQTDAYLGILAVQLGFELPGGMVASSHDAQCVAEYLRNHQPQAVGALVVQYQEWIARGGKEAGMADKEFAVHVFSGATCGYGSNPYPQLRAVSYDLAAATSDALVKLYN